MEVKIKKMDLITRFLRKTLYEAGYTQDFIIRLVDNDIINIAGRLTSKKGFTATYNVEDNSLISAEPYRTKKLPLTETELYTILTASAQALEELMEDFQITAGTLPIQDVRYSKKTGLLTLVSKEQEPYKKEKSVTIETPTLENVTDDEVYKIEFRYASADLANRFTLTSNKTFWHDLGKEMAETKAGRVFTPYGDFSFRTKFGDNPKFKFSEVPKQLLDTLRKEKPITLTDKLHTVTIDADPKIYWGQYYFYINAGYKPTTGQINKNTGKTKFLTLAYENLWKQLHNASKRYLSMQISAGYKPDFETISQAKWYLDRMRNLDNIDEINGCIDILADLIPRLTKRSDLYVKPGKVEAYSVLDREESIIMSLENDLLNEQGIVATSEVFDPLGVTVTDPSAGEIARIQKMLVGQKKVRNMEYGAKILSVYKIDDPESNRQLQEYKDETGHTKTSLLWHGSKTESWPSILKNKLTYTPENLKGDTVFRRTGSMFGNGLYFASNAFKSMQFTSMARTRIGVMCLFEVVTEFKQVETQPRHHNYHTVNEAGYDLLYVKAGGNGILNRDEYVVFDTRNNAPRYLVFFEY